MEVLLGISLGCSLYHCVRCFLLQSTCTYNRFLFHFGSDFHGLASIPLKGRRIIRMTIYLSLFLLPQKGGFESYFKWATFNSPHPASECIPQVLLPCHAGSVPVRADKESPTISTYLLSCRKNYPLTTDTISGFNALQVYHERDNFALFIQTCALEWAGQ